jgi:hypothetical protein
VRHSPFLAPWHAVLFAALALALCPGTGSAGGTPLPVAADPGQLVRRPGPPARSKPADGSTFDTRQFESVGTMLLADIGRLVRRSPILAGEVKAALRELKKTPNDITCIGRRIDGGWRYLAGARVQPYACQIGKRWLEIQAELRILGRRGEIYTRAGRAAMKNARIIREVRPRWNWTDQRPQDWILD